MMRLLVPLILLAPLALADPTQDAVHLFATGGSILADVRYADGIGTTKFGFAQLAGQGGGPTQRLDAGALCTEWVGTFTQVLIEATATDNVASAQLAFTGTLASIGPTQRSTPSFTLDALGGAGAFEGSLLVCDDAAGQGKVRFTARVVPIPLTGAQPALVRLTEG